MVDGQEPPDIPMGGGEQTIPASPADQPPTSLVDGRYRIERVIGEGAFGRVYLALDTRLKRHVAVKELLSGRNKTDGATYERYLERFQREARAGGVVQHPNVVAVYELAIDRDENYYLIMEYIDGTDLRDLLAQVGTLPIERVVALATEVARALEAVHEQDIVHRDLKPANIMLTRRGVAKLTDFGIAQVGNESHRTQVAIGHPGTPIYMSPEQSSGYGYIDGRSDLYSLGLLIYEMLVGEPYARKRQPLASVRPDLSPPLIAIVNRLMMREPDERYQQAGEVALALASLSSAQPGLATAADVSPLPLSTDPQPRYGGPGSGAPSALGAQPYGVPPAYGGAGSQSQPGLPVYSGTVPPSQPPTIVAGSPLPYAAADSPFPYAAGAIGPPAKSKRGLFLGLGGAVVAIVAVIAIVAVVSGGSKPIATATPARNSTASSTVVAGASSSTPAATATPSPTATTTSATATPVRTATPSATATPTGSGTRPVSTLSAGYSTDFTKWTTETASQYRRGYDTASGEYHLAILVENTTWWFSAPDSPNVADFVYEIDVRQTAGPDNGRYGVVFRAQPLGQNEKGRVHYYFLIDGRGQYGLYLNGTDNAYTTVQALTAAPAGVIKTGPNAVNHLSVTCKGDKITLAINGTTLKTYTATLTQAGTIGIGASELSNTSGLEVGYKNLRLSAA